MLTVRDRLGRFTGAVWQLLLVSIAVLPACSTSAVAQPSSLVVSVAASVSDAIEEIAVLYRSSTGVTVAVNAGGSNMLAAMSAHSRSAITVTRSWGCTFRQTRMALRAPGASSLSKVVNISLLFLIRSSLLPRPKAQQPSRQPCTRRLSSGRRSC